MTTFVDDGLLDIISDGPDSPLAIDESKVIDLDDINASIEDPGYILEEPLDTIEESEKYTSSYGKRSFTLPVSFFDISSNIKLLTQCRPISISIVDCELHPWYYKRYRRTNNTIKTLYDIKDEQQNNVDHHEFDAQKSEDVLDLTHCERKEETLTISQNNFSGIKLSSEQRLAVLKLKERIKNDIEKSFTHTDDVNESGSALIINNKKEKLEDQYSNKVPQQDLLAYCKAIAQSIVRNTDHGKTKLKPKTNAVEDSKLIKTNLFYNDIQFADDISNTYNTPIPQKNKTKIEKANEKVITSPILPCTIKQKKKTESKRSVIKNNTVANHHSENSSNLKNCCDRLTSSAHRVIPHYHNLPLHPGPAIGYQSQYMDSSQMMLHYYSIQRSEMINTLTQQTMAEMRCLAANKDQAMNSHNMFIPSANYVRGLPPTNVEPNSCYNFSNTFSQNLPLMSSMCQQIDKKAVQPITPQQHTNFLAPHYNYANALSLNGCSSHIVKNSAHKNDIITGTNFGNLHNSKTSEHDTINYNSTVVPSQQNHNLIATANPLLSQMLNQSVKPQGYLYTNQQYTERNKLLYPNDVQNATSVVSNENINVHQYFYPTFVTPSKEPSSIVGLAFQKENPVSVTKNKTIKIIARKKCKPKNANTNNNIILSTNTRSNAPNTADRQVDMGVYDNIKTSRVDNSLIFPHRINNDDQNRQMDTRFYTENVELTNYNASATVQSTKNPVVDFKTLIEVPSTKNCYSPAILPIPTFKKSLEMLSELQKNTDPKIISNTNGKHISRKNQKPNLIRKRKQNDNNDVKVKKISLQEYKQRIESCKANATKTDGIFSGNVKIEDNKAVYDCDRNVDTLMDLGYDSDTTVILDTVN